MAKDMKAEEQTGRVFVCCFALRSNKILAAGCNSYDEHHPRKHFGNYQALKSNDSENYNSGLHAEVKVLKQLGYWMPKKTFNNIELFVVRLSNNRNMNPVMAIPCKNCQRVLSNYPFKKISFTTDIESVIGELKS
jgi:deoxycytidylate deaminase